MSGAEKSGVKVGSNLTSRELVHSAYRIQLNSHFTFDDAASILPYLRRLGISHVYASPFLQARPGSTHGYDVVDHNAINSELGGAAAFDRFAKSLRDNGLGLIADIVPNHVGISGNCNRWWNDVLEYGRKSEFAEYFDIHWENKLDGLNQDKVILPILGKPYLENIKDGSLKLEISGTGLSFSYYGTFLPLSPPSLASFFALLPPDRVTKRLDFEEKLSMAQAPTLGREYREISNDIKVELFKALQDPVTADLVKAEVRAINESPARLDKLIGEQNWRLIWWKIAPDEINYRRFFDINELAALKTENESVFSAIHTLIFRLIADGKIDGLRIDHPDGLFDPAQYLERLHKRYLAATHPDGERPPEQGVRNLYILVEKILSTGEELSPSWKCDGTTGYEFITTVNSFFVDKRKEEAFNRVWQPYSGGKLPREVLHDSRRFIINNSFSGQLEMLAFELFKFSRASLAARDFSLRVLKDALEQLIIHFPVYRTYITEKEISSEDMQVINKAVQSAKEARSHIPVETFDFIKSVIANPGEIPGISVSASRRWTGKLQQLTAPVTAKGVEDTAFYRYPRLLSLNEVGGDICSFGAGPDDLHAYFRKRAACCPYSLSPLSTHDTKRSEDVRARLNVLSEIPDEWQVALAHLEQSAVSLAGYKKLSPSDRYLIFQSLIGAWPPGHTQCDPDFASRFLAYLKKALREAKLKSSWTSPDEEYENHVFIFTEELLASDQFYQFFLPFQQKVSWYGLLNSVSQTVIRLTAPGVPDTYQGQEIWDFSLVDPDNRRPVDYSTSEKLLSSTEGLLPAGTDLKDPVIKLHITNQLLRVRNQYPGLLREGTYIPLKAAGRHEENVLGFLRQHGEVWSLVSTGRFFTGLSGTGQLPTGEGVWGDTQLLTPPGTPSTFEDILTGNSVTITSNKNGGFVKLSQIFTFLPAAVLISRGVIHASCHASPGFLFCLSPFGECLP